MGHVNTVIWVYSHSKKETKKKNTRNNRVTPRFIDEQPTTDIRWDWGGPLIDDCYILSEQEKSRRERGNASGDDDAVQTIRPCRYLQADGFISREMIVFCLRSPAEIVLLVRMSMERKEKKRKDEGSFLCCRMYNVGWMIQSPASRFRGTRDDSASLKNWMVVVFPHAKMDFRPFSSFLLVHEHLSDLWLQFRCSSEWKFRPFSVVSVLWAIVRALISSLFIYFLSLFALCYFSFINKYLLKKGIAGQRPT